MTIAFFSLLGACWHLVIEALKGRALWAFDWGMLAGCVTGVAAGYFTLWTRRRSPARDSLWSVVATYYLAILVYWIAGSLLYLWLRAGTKPMDRQLSFIWSNLGWYLAYGTIWSIILLPLCWATRWIVWRVHGSLRPNKA